VLQVLELDPATFNPTLSLKYGRLLAPTSESSLRIQLHPSCVPVAHEDEDAVYGDQEEEQGYYEGDEEEQEEYGLKKKLKFGQDAFDAGEESKEDLGLWEGEWSGDVRLVK
jgi:hypothetical protein